MLGGRSFPKGSVRDPAVVVTVTVTVVVPFKVKELGLIVQVESAGAPLQVRFTVWLRPPSGTRTKVYVTVCPGVMVALTAPGPPDDDNWKSNPVPES